MDKDMNNNLKDVKEKSLTSYGTDVSSVSTPLSYTKTHKLVTALYMVTDIIDKEEPIRNKLRILGVEIISDIATSSKSVLEVAKIDQAMSFLNIALAMNFISEMNCSILVKEFLELKLSIQEYVNIKPVWLEEFLSSNDVFPPPFSGEDLRRGFNSPHPNPLLAKERVDSNTKGHVNTNKGHTRIGVQKGSTLMKALSDKTHLMSDRVNNEARPNTLGLASRAQDFDMLKKQRRYNIVSFIKNNNGNATIKDIRNKIDNGTSDSPACSEKTLQRELLSMIKDGVLYKTGEKRWSRYFMK
ncbi:MAG: hypothetical protein WCG28_00015 [bacterium]